MANTDTAVQAAYAGCRGIARRHYENFPVASRLVPQDQRDALAAIYAFARTADDFADEPDAGPVHELPLRRLADWRRRLRACYGKGDSSTAPVETPRAPSCADYDLIFIAVADAAGRFNLSEEHFDHLIEAFELDVTTHRHRDFASLLSYCSCSANPVGRLVLELFGHRDPELFALSDSLCTGLQLANFWQDVAMDLAHDRVYLPLEDIERFNYSIGDLRAQQADDHWKKMMSFEVARTREFFERSRSLPERVAPGLRRQLRVTWLGGMAILAKIESAGYDVLRHRPKLSRWDFLRLYLKARQPLCAQQDSADPAEAITGRS